MTFASSEFHYQPRKCRPKLPKMNNSERGKYYRQKYREYEANLVVTVEELRSLVGDLQAILVTRAHSSTATAWSNLSVLCEYFACFRSAVRYTDVPFPSSRPSGWTIEQLHHGLRMERPSTPVLHAWDEKLRLHRFTTFRCLSLAVHGAHDCYVVQIKGTAITRYSIETLEDLYPHILTNEALVNRLVNKEIKYGLTNHFHFTERGELQHSVVESDLVEGLLEVLGSLTDVAMVMAAPETTTGTTTSDGHGSIMTMQHILS